MKTFDDEVTASDGSKIIKHGRDAPAWMVTYADLMSLLFALFVLILSFSTVNDDSFQQNAGPMREAFNQNSEFKTDDKAVLSGGLGILDGVKSVEMDVDSPSELRDKLIDNLRYSLSRDIINNLVELEATANGAVLRFPSNTAFEPGGAELSAISYVTLDKIVPVLARTPGDIIIGGHTDDIPIKTLQFRSNWDLSTARATSVVHHFIRSGKIPKERLTSQGYADSRPLKPNDSELNRSINRRVEITIEIPEDTEEARKFLENLPETQRKIDPSRMRIWSIDEDEEEVTDETEAMSQEERLERARERNDALEAERLNQQSQEGITNRLRGLNPKEAQ